MPLESRMSVFCDFRLLTDELKAEIPKEPEVERLSKSVVCGSSSLY
jgi:hypothetical protein